MKVLNDSAHVLDYSAVGFSVRATVELSAPSQIANSLKSKLLLAPEVLSVSVIVGDGLLNLDVIAVDMDHLHAFVKSLQGSGSTTTRILLAEEKSTLTLVERIRKLDESAASLVMPP